MATQSIIDKQFFQLISTDAAPPSRKYPKEHERPDDGTRGGCSICPSVAYFGRADDGTFVSIVLPETLPAPERLEVVVIDEGNPDRRYVPRPDALALLVSTRRSRWTFPPDAPPPQALTISYGFMLNGAMVSEDHAASPPSAPVPTVRPPAASEA